MEIFVGHKVDGTPRRQTHHWNNLKIAVWDDDQQEISRPNRGRKRKNESTISEDASNVAENSDNVRDHPFSTYAKNRHF